MTIENIVKAFRYRGYNEFSEYFFAAIEFIERGYRLATEKKKGRVPDSAPFFFSPLSIPLLLTRSFFPPF